MSIAPPPSLRRLCSLLLAAGLAVAMTAVASAPADAQLRQLRKAIQKNVQLAVERQRLRLRVENSAGPIEALAIGPDGQFMVSISGDGRPRVWDLQNGREIRRQDRLAASPAAVAFASDGRRFAIAEQNGGLSLWSTDEADPLGRATLSGPAPTALALSPDGAAAVVGHADGSATLLRLSDFSIVSHFAGNGPPATNVDVGATGQFILIGATDGTVRVIEASSGAVVRTSKATGATLTDARFGIDETEFYIADEAGTVSKWRVDTDDVVDRFTGASGGIAGLAVEPSGKAIAAVQQTEKLLIWETDAPDKPTIIEAHPGRIEGVAFDADPGRVITFGEDGVTRVWSRQDGSLIIQLISTENGWAVVDRDGRFDGSSRALSNLAWVGETLELPIDNFTDNLYEPDLLEKKRLGVGQMLSPGVPNWDEGILPPPTAIVDMPAQMKLDALTEIDVKVTVKDEGGGINGFFLFHNTKLVSPDRIARQDEKEGGDGLKTIEAIYKVRPIAGQNLFHSNAVSSESILGATNLVTVTVQAPPREPVLHVLTVAINQYLDPQLNLNYALPDARGIQQIMEAEYGQIFGEVRIREVFDDKATRRGMQQALADLQDTAPEDVVVIYYAGHGEATEEDFFFVTYEFELPLSASRLERRALSAASLRKYVENIGARRVIMLIDACKSGTAVAGFQDQMDRRVIRRLGQSVGLHIVSATAKEQFAVEHASLGHGVFTYALIQAMAGAADIDPHDGNLTVREVVHYSEDAVPALSQKYAKYQHWPLIYSRGLDFTLGKVSAQ